MKTGKLRNGTTIQWTEKKNQPVYEGGATTFRVTPEGLKQCQDSNKKRNKDPSN